MIGVEGRDTKLGAVRAVWASLWSDAALLYRRELSLHPLESRMAVLVQRMRVEDRSGVAFGRDPREPEADSAVVEAVPGQCSLLVDGAVDPDRWFLRRSTGEVILWRPGVRRLKQLADRVTKDLIPQLESEGARLAAEDIEGYDDRRLAAAIEVRHECLNKWKKVYWDEFIPFAHGVRQLARYYNDALRPSTPTSSSGCSARRICWRRAVTGQSPALPVLCDESLCFVRP